MLGNKESYENWRDLLRHMVRRELKVPLMITLKELYDHLLLQEKMGLTEIIKYGIRYKNDAVVKEVTSNV